MSALQSSNPDDQFESAAPPRGTIILSSYMSGAAQGRNLGESGYSYDFLARAFAPLLRQWGPVVEIRDADELDRAIERARSENSPPIHVSILPLQDVTLSSMAPNIVVPAWEFPDVPDHAFDGNPRNNWLHVARGCAAIWAGGPFTANTLRNGGVQVPIQTVQTPTPTEYFDVPRWTPGSTTSIDCPAIIFPQGGVADVAPTSPPLEAAPPPPAMRARLKGALRHLASTAFKRFARPLLPFCIDQGLTAGLRAAARSWRNPRAQCLTSTRVELSGIVFTSIFNPDDPRKNWEDLITGFLQALGDREDATLVLKLVCRSPRAVDQVLSFYRSLDRAHRCKLVLISGYLTQPQMLALTEATTCYITTTRAEGMCLPLMSYLAAGRPAVAPVHSAIGDYFGERIGFVVESHPEPAAWPQDSRRRWKTTWGRMVWPSLVRAITQAYTTAAHDEAAYRALAGRARETLRDWSHPHSVWPRLRNALDLVLAGERSATSPQGLPSAAPAHLRFDSPHGCRQNRGGTPLTTTRPGGDPQ